MEFRQLVNEAERDVFIEQVERARAAAGIFRETSRMQSENRRRLAASQLYGLFKDEAASADRMIAGIATHDLEAFPQSCREPDLSDFIPRTVFECSDHWSLSSGAGLFVWAGLAKRIRVLGVKAVIAYLAAGDLANEHAGFYAAMGFVGAGPIVEHPFVEAAGGGYLRVQPVILQGAALVNVIDAFAAEFSDDVPRMRSFMRPLLRGSSRRPSHVERRAAAAVPSAAEMSMAG
ncbi:MAG TPA: hypothetical protein VKS22_08230 [Candidatus Binataceae bacterium]|nr:hypothetical protein [Candidatus Binataceae bacterium]